MMKDSASAPPQQPYKMKPTPASQHHMMEMPPPSYSEAMPGPAPLPGPKGWCFAITCCLFGSWLASLLVRCLPGFRRFTHLCPLCRALIGEAQPSHSGKHIALIIFVTILALVLVGFMIASRIFRV